MTAERWERVKQIVADALDLDRDKRPQFIDQQCGSDPILRGDVETLLRADDPNSAFLDLERPQRIGPYRVVREIGRGGMGTVFLAERADGQFEQRVAIKVIKRGMDTDAVLRRFYAERQILARLQHPHITRLLDGGTVDYRPYFVMEYLEGEPLVEYCRGRNLPIAPRIRLFLTVCEAVEYAHRSLILHRDLKTSNILVDRNGVPKLLDFGIAKLLEVDGEPGLSLVAERPLTPQAASPEQVKGEPLTTASDVYGLGMLLFDLLAGRPAYRVASGAPLEMHRLVCEQPPPKPSSVAEAGTAKLLRGDLDNIILKALEKEPTRRYQHAADLAADLRRHLEGRPVEARAGGRLYRAGKFVRRHRRSLAVAAVVLLALSAAIFDAILQGRRAARRFDDLRQLAGSFLFEFHDAIAPLPGSTPARELVVKRALQYLDNLSREASGDVGLKREAAAGYLRVGAAQGSYFESNLGKTNDARASFAKAEALYAEVARTRPGDPQAQVDLARAKLALISIDYSSHTVASGVSTLEQVVGMLEPLARKRQLDTAGQVILGQAWFGLSERQMTAQQDQPALQARLRSIEILRAAVAGNPSDPEAQRWLAQSEKRLAYLYLQRLHDLPKAEENLQSSLAIDQQRAARDPSNAVIKLDLALDHSYLSAVARRRGDLKLALQLLDASISARSEVMTADPRNVRVRSLLIGDYTRLGGWMREGKRPAESRAAFDQGIKLADAMDPAAAKNPDAAEVIATLKREAERQ